MGEGRGRLNRPSQRRATGYLLKGLAVAGFIGTFAALAFVATAINEQNGGLGERGQAIFTVAFYTVMGATAFLGYRLYRRGRQHTALLGEEVVGRDTRPPIVYLRSFSDEVAIAREEEILATIFGEAGPFVAIGRPGDPLPPLGASRFYVADANWQGFVASLLGKASLVLVLAGRTPGLVWEVARCRQLLDPRRLVVLVPLEESSYTGFRESFRSGAGIDLPEHRELRAGPHRTKMLCGAIIFDNAWRPQVRLFEKALWRGYRFAYRLRGTGWRPKQARLWLMMHSLGTRAGLTLRAPGFNWALAYVVVSLIIVAGMLGLSLSGVLG
jgi:hypothetical protein